MFSDVVLNIFAYVPWLKISVIHSKLCAVSLVYWGYILYFLVVYELQGDINSFSSFHFNLVFVQAIMAAELGIILCCIVLFDVLSSFK